MPGPAGPEAEAAMWKAGGPNASESKVDFATERPSVMLLPRGREEGARGGATALQRRAAPLRLKLAADTLSKAGLGASLT